MAVNRFSSGKKNPFKKIAVLLPILGFIILLVMVLRGISSVSKTTAEKQRESLETALNRSIVQCYAVEGTYPPSLEYIVEHYGLTYDTNRFYVEYSPIGTNLMPDVTIIEIGD